MTAYQTIPVADHIFTIKRVNADSWWVTRSDITAYGRRSGMPRVVFFATSEAEVNAWLDSREKPFFVRSEY